MSNPIITTIADHGKVIGFYGGSGGYCTVYTPSVKPIKLGYLEYYVRLSSSATNKWGWIAPNNTNAYTGIGYLGGSQAIICWTDSGGTYHSEKVMNISPFVWYKVKVIFNHTTGSAAVYVNDLFKKSFTYGPVSAGTNGVKMTTSNGFLSYVMFDNISLWATDVNYVP